MNIKIYRVINGKGKHRWETYIFKKRLIKYKKIGGPRDALTIYIEEALSAMGYTYKDSYLLYVVSNLLYTGVDVDNYIGDTDQRFEMKGWSFLL